MNLIKLTFFLILLLPAFVPAGASFAPVRNFPSESYRWGTQNWAVAQDSQGRMYFGNKNGLMVYDGTTWDRYVMTNRSTVRSILLEESTGRIYVGGSDDFGYFSFDHGRNYPSYHSLRLDATPRSLGEVWNIHRLGERLLFQGDHNVITVAADSVAHMLETNDKIFTSAVAGERLYLSLQNGGLSVMSGTAVESADKGGILKGKKIVSILPYDDKVILVTEYDGIYILSSGNITKFNSGIDDFLRDSQAFCAATKATKLAIGTVAQGLVVLDMVDKSATFVNSECDLQNNTVLTAFFDRIDNVWCGLDDGIDYVLCKSPFYNLLGSANSYGAGYASLMHGNKLYLGTNQGLYVSDYPLPMSPREPTITRKLRGQIWKIASIGGTVAVCADAGLFRLDGNGDFEAVASIPGAWDIEELAGHPGEAIVSTYDGFYRLSTEGTAWENLGRIDGFADTNGHFRQDGNGNIWIANWLRGVYKLHLAEGRQTFDKVDFFDTSRGLGSNDNNTMWPYGDSLVFSSGSGFYTYDTASDTMLAEPELSGIFAGMTAPHLYSASPDELWSVTPDGIHIATFKPTGRVEVDSVTLATLGQKLIPGFEDFNFVDNAHIIVSSRDGFLEIDRSRMSAPPHRECRTFVGRIFANQDSLVYQLATDSAAHLELPSDLNSLRFEFFTPEYRADGAVVYSHRLDNYDKDWSSFSRTATKEYTKLSPGDYTLCVKAFNTISRETGECYVRFSILPPWYLSGWAKTVYFFLIMGVLYGVWMAVSRKMKQSAQRMERRREYEIAHVRRVAQEATQRQEDEIESLKTRQIEQDIQYKTEELSSITMNVVRKNEILLNISSRLSKVRRSIEAGSTGEAGSQIARIQAIIEENINHDDDWQSFANNFDAVYYDFTKRLRQAHPGLTPTELRVCCYLRMGLSSKEMAPLFNISYRSVEMTRYRLRKKLGLDRDINLGDYLSNF